MPRGGIKKPIGYETIWKDRKNRTRVKIKVAEGKKFIDKRIYIWKKYHPNDNLKGYVIMHKDNDPLNFDINNLAKIKKEVFLLMLSNNLLCNNASLNETGILIAQNMYESKKRIEQKKQE